MAKPEETGSNRQFRWTARKEEAAVLLASGEMTDLEIAAHLKTSDRSLRAWKRAPVFAARVEKLVKEIGAPALRFAVALRNSRIKALNARWHAMQKVIADRAADTRMGGVPGGPTGLLVIEESESAFVEEITEHPDGSTTLVRRPVTVPTKVKVDVALLKEMRDTERQAAQEVGDWVQKIAPTTPDGKKQHHGDLLARLNVEQLRQLDALLACAEQNGSAGGVVPAQPG